MKLIDFPILRQSTLDTCSCASVQTCLSYYGINKRETQIRRLMSVKKNPKEVHPRKLVKALKHFKLKAKYKKYTLDELIKTIDKNIPVILNLQAWYTMKVPDFKLDNDGHYAVAIGYDAKKKRIIFSDPEYFLRVYLSYEELEKRWHDGSPTDWDYDHMGVAVWGKTPVYKSDKIVRMR